MSHDHNHNQTVLERWRAALPLVAPSQRELVLATIESLESAESALSTATREALEKAAKVCELSASELQLIAGEMTAGELRTCRAVLRSRAAAIRTLAP